MIFFNQNLSTLQNISLKFKDYRVIATVFCVIVSNAPIGHVIPFIAILGVLSVGILHGANDLSLIKKLEFLSSTSQRFVVYICFVALFAALLYRIPVFALTVFVGISAYHFGEQQWQKHIATQSSKVLAFYFMYGLFLFATLFYVHASEVIRIVYQISGLTMDVYFFEILVSSASVLLMLTILFTLKHTKTLLVDLLFQTTVIVFLFGTTDLLVAFAVYFVFWHSWPSLKDQVSVLYGANSSVGTYLKDAWLYWLLSIVGLVLMYFYNDSLGLDPLALFFAFLAAITFPHVLVIFGLNRLFKPNTNA